VSPYPEDDVVALIERIGAERVLFGSDFPHPEGLADPVRFAELLEGRSAGDVRRVMRDNAVELFAGSAR
jgi:predicted TIM-barrel fold metal-dependent hydrolase